MIHRNTAEEVESLSRRSILELIQQYQKLDTQAGPKEAGSDYLIARFYRAL